MGRGNGRMSRTIAVNTTQVRQADALSPQQLRTESFSSLDTYLLCPYKYKLKYIDKIKTDYINSRQFVGSCVHKALEWLHDARLHCKDVTWRDLVAEYKKSWRECLAGNKVMRPVDETMAGAYRYGLICLKNYWKHIYATDRQGETVGVEVNTSFELDEGIKMTGFIDRLVVHPGECLEIIDYKTGAHIKSQSKVDEDDQLALYALWASKQYPEYAGKVRLTWHYLRTGLTMRSTRTPEQLEELRQRYIALNREIAGATEFPAKENNFCKTCEYASMCPKKAHAYKVATQGADEGVFLADQYRQVDDEIKRIKKQQEALKKQMEELSLRKIELMEKLRQFADAEGVVEAVIGTNSRVSLSGNRVTLARKDHSVALLAEA